VRPGIAGAADPLPLRRSTVTMGVWSCAALPRALALHLRCAPRLCPFVATLGASALARVCPWLCLSPLRPLGRSAPRRDMRTSDLVEVDIDDGGLLDRRTGLPRGPNRQHIRLITCQRLNKRG